MVSLLADVPDVDEPVVTQPRCTFLAALRPFSLIVAVATCSLGITLAAVDGFYDHRLAVLVVVAGVLLQAGVNLINDHADLHHLGDDAQLRRRVQRNARLGVLAIAMACLIGVVLIGLRGWPMAVIGGLGVMGGWGYTAAPLRLKSRGLGVVAVFFFTGILMVLGAYYAMAGVLSLIVPAIALPFSLFASLLLLANELRDFEADTRDGHRTFTVRFGYTCGVRLYHGLVLMLAVLTPLLLWHQAAPLLILPWLALLLMVFPLRLLMSSSEERFRLPRLTGRCYAVYAALFVFALWGSQP